MNIRHRILYLLLSMLSCFLLLFGYYLQYFNHIQPCLLCMIQRLCVLALIFIFFIAIFTVRGGITKVIFNLLAVFFSTLGLMTAIRQVWLQHQPITDSALTCLPSASILLKTFPITEVIKMIYAGTADCATINWTFLGFSIAEWSLFFFAVISVTSLFQFRRLR